MHSCTAAHRTHSVCGLPSCLTTRPLGSTSLPRAGSYNGARNSDKFLEFLKEKLEEDKGFARVAEMDKLALKFIAEGANTASIIADAETQAGKASKEDKEAAALYVTFMKRALDKVCGQ